MSGPMLGRNTEDNRVVLGLLESIERNSVQSQRKLAAELGVALGLVNIYIRRCVKKGLLKIGTAPAGRYAYYITPQGFAEKARLTLDYLSYSFDLFRRARADCVEVFDVARSRNFQRIIVAGVSDLTEVAAICARESGIHVVAIVDGRSALSTFAGYSVVASFDRVEGAFDAVLVADLNNAKETFTLAVQKFGSERVLIPSMLRARVANPVEEAS
jgi:DNA-binding MarR family transcriptional regulator